MSEVAAIDFIPPTPIRVHVVSDDIDEVRPDSREALPTAGAERASQAYGWDKEVDAVLNPPPAYGRWRGSVRADPDLLHWQPIPSPVDPGTPTLPSPTYEEVMSAGHPVEQTTEPPSYVTRDSPERRREMNGGVPEHAQAQVVQPEMVEGRGIGNAA